MTDAPYRATSRHTLEVVLEVNLEATLEYVLGIKTMTLVLSPGSRSESLSLTRN